MDDLLRLLTPLQRTVRAIVIDALAMGPGETLPINTHYLAQFETSAGSIQRALRLLSDQGALKVVSRGHLGRVIRSIDVGRAWNIAGLRPICLLFPPAGPPEIDAITEHVINILTKHHIAYSIVRKPGGASRLEALARGEADIALTSAGVRSHSSDTFDDEMTYGFGRGSYYGGGNLLLITRATQNEPGEFDRIAIDRDSPDHEKLTSILYSAERSYTLVDVPFPQIPAAILGGDADAGIWHNSKLTIPLELCGLRATPMTGSEYERIWNKLSAAVLTGNKCRPELRSLFRVIEECRLDHERADTG